VRREEVRVTVVRATAVGFGGEQGPPPAVLFERCGIAHAARSKQSVVAPFVGRSVGGPRKANLGSVEGRELALVEEDLDLERAAGAVGDVLAVVQFVQINLEQIAARTLVRVHQLRRVEPHRRQRHLLAYTASSSLYDIRVMKKSLWGVVALGTWFLVLSLYVLASTSAAQKRFDEGIYHAKHRHYWGNVVSVGAPKPLKRAKAAQRSIDTARAVGHVSLFAAVVAFAGVLASALAPPNFEQTLTLGSTELSVAWRTVARTRGGSKRKSSSLWATVLAALGVLEAAVLVGFVASLRKGQYFLVKVTTTHHSSWSDSDYTSTYGEKSSLSFGHLRKNYFPFGITALVVSALVFLFFARKHLASFGTWLLDKCYDLGGVLDSVVEDDEEEGEDLVSDTDRGDVEVADRHSPPDRGTPAAVATTTTPPSADVVAVV